MATQVHKPSDLSLTTPEREDIGRPSRYWTFINRSSYYVFVVMGFNESAVLSDPDFVIEPYTVQRVDFPTPSDKVTWQANLTFPKVSNPFAARDLFGFTATDTPMNAYPASVLTVGLNDPVQAAVTGDVNVTGGTINAVITQAAEGDVALILDNELLLATSDVIKIKTGADSFVRFRMDNRGAAFMGIGTATEQALWAFLSSTAMQFYKGMEFRGVQSLVSGTPDAPNTACWLWSVAGNAFTDNTAESNSAGGVNFAAGIALNDTLYFGNSVPFSTIITTLGTLGIAGVRTWEYWNGSAWVSLSPVPSPAGAENFTASGTIDFGTAPTGWVQRPLSGVQANTPPDATARYWLRARVTTVYTTQPTVAIARPPVTSQTVTKVPHIAIYDNAGVLQATIDPDGNVRAASVGYLYEPGWTPITLLNSWSNVGGAFQTAAYRKTLSGKIEVKGMITGGNGNAGTILFTLPVGARPAESYRMTNPVAATSTNLEMQASGSLTLQSILASAVSLMIDTDFWPA